MKKILIFLVLVFLFNIGNCQEYETIVDTTKQWSIVTECWSEENYPEILSASTIGYRFRGDTIINSLHYSFLEACVDSLFENWGRYRFLFRDDSAGRVYVHDYNKEILLYDYNVEVGDTIWIPNISDFSYSVEMTIVDSIGIELIANKVRKVVYFGGLFSLYAKGFGTYGGPLGLFYNFFVGNCGKSVSCFKQNNTLLYMDSTYSKCYFHYDDIEENETFEKNIKISPNPVTDISVLDFKEFNDTEFINIYSLDGTLVKQIKTKGKNKIFINKKDYLPGMYFYRAKSSKGKYFSGRFIIL